MTLYRIDHLLSADSLRNEAVAIWLLMDVALKGARLEATAAHRCEAVGIAQLGVDLARATDGALHVVSNRHRRVRRYRYHSGIDVGRVAAVAAIESVKRR